MATVKFHHFGHSFPKRLFRYMQDTGLTVANIINPPDSCELFIDGYSGLTYNKIFLDPSRFLQRIKRNNCSEHPIDVLNIDLGTNDLCNPEIKVSDLVNSAVSFINLLEQEGITPKYIVFLSVIQRSHISRANQVTVACFNHRAKKFNAALSRELKTNHSNVFMFAQDRVNFPKYLEDGVHFTNEGRRKYARSLRRMMYRFKHKFLGSE